MDTKHILKKRFLKLQKHYFALKEYKTLIDKLTVNRDIYNPHIFNSLQIEHKALLDAYLRRFASVQDFLGAKIFSILLQIVGISTQKMSEVLSHIEKENIIDSIENWIELREIRNELEHDYPDDLQEALNDLKYCIDNFYRLEKYYLNSLNFYKKHTNESI